MVELGKSAGNEETITDLDAVTSYSIQVMVSNNGGFQTSTALQYRTGELGTISDHLVWQAWNFFYKGANFSYCLMNTIDYHIMLCKELKRPTFQSTTRICKPSVSLSPAGPSRHSHS